MPLRDDMKLISIDDHVIEHPRVWQDRLPSKYRDVGPRIVESDEVVLDQYDNPLEGSHELWVYEGRRYPQFALNAVVDKDPKDFGLEPARFDEIMPGCYDPGARVRDMDQDGIQAQMCFPTFPRFSGTLFLEAEDKELALLCVQAWNDFMIDEWCGTAPDRLIPLMITPFWDVPSSVREIERCAAKGAKAITFPENTATLGHPSFHTDHWDPLFAAAQDTGLPLCMHFGSSGRPPTTGADAPMTVWISTMGTNSMLAVADLLFSPIFHKFPSLKVAFQEGGIGWVPYMMERIDYVWERHKYYTGVNTEVRPSDLFRTNMWVCFIEDFAGIKNRHDIGLDRITWECDYPHSDSNWPNSRKRAAEQLADVPDDEVSMIVEKNARTLLNWHEDER